MSQQRAKIKAATATITKQRAVVRPRCRCILRLEKDKEEILQHVGTTPLPSLRGMLRIHAKVEARYACIVLHGHGMQATEMVEWLQDAICNQFPHVEFFFLQAPVSWQESSLSFLPSWMQYKQEFDGIHEDEICGDSLRATTAALTGIAHECAHRVGLDMKQCIVLGLSEGGCLAIELACCLALTGVITIVSHRRTNNADAPLLSPWYALTGNTDKTYAPPWATQYLHQAHKWVTVDDDHYLNHTDKETMAFLVNALTDMTRA